MINLFVEFGFQLLNMEALLDFELIERSSILKKTTIVAIYFPPSYINKALT